VKTVVAIAVSVLPIFLFLCALVLIDSYKLVGLHALLLAVTAGLGAALASFGVTVWLRPTLEMELLPYARYVAPFIEEGFKAAYVTYLLARNRVGFVVDAGILGFAIGSGFAALENLYYLQDPSATIWTWIVRGFGTAVMHGGSTAILAMVATALRNRSEKFSIGMVLPGLAAAVVLHSLYNHFILQPLLATAVIMLVFPWAAMFIFQQSEKNTRAWLGSGFDTDQQLLLAMRSGQMAQTPAGKYLASIRSRFAPEVIVDMLCLLRLRAELGIRAKGLLMMREAGFDEAAAPDPAIRQTFEEVRYLEKNIGRTGMLALHPFMHTSTRDLWQLNLLDEQKS
jgi:RsiW-degrading membrane proteinase PrsW (M82 family)